jgi:3-deoxy-D-manno-octulosonic-acid transferase
LQGYDLQMKSNWTENLLRAAYAAVLYLLVPVTVYHLVWRGFRHNAYFQRWGERYGRYSTVAPTRSVWIHAVSVGEVNAAEPIVNWLRKHRPDLRLLVTTITPTGSARVRELWGQSIEHVYLPYDLPGAVKRFYAHFKPAVGMIMETEIWPSLLFCARDAKIPLYVLNARLSERSLRGYRVLAPLVSRAVATLTGIAAQSATDGKRFVRLGARPESVHVLGNIKFDAALQSDAPLFADAFHAHAGDRPVWIAASTHIDEEAVVIAMHRHLQEQFPGLLLAWAPRHPERFRPIAADLAALKMKFSLRSAQQWPSRDDSVFLIDTIGELSRFYPCAQVAFVGGSLQAIGGHNLLEPAAARVPVVTGPALFNFAEISKRLREADGMIVGNNASEVEAAIAMLLSDSDKRTQMADAAESLIRQGRGALDRILALVEPDLPMAPTAVAKRTGVVAPSSQT